MGIVPFKINVNPSNAMRTKLQRKSISQLSKIILAGLAGSLLGAVASTAQEANAPTAVKPTVVTGSYIPTAETVGPSPIDTVSTEAIQKTGQQDILTSLKILNAGFSGGYNIGHTVNNGGFGEAYIAIRNLPTLVLIDGERVNITPFSTFFGTFAVDVNTIPLAAIDRIEVLKDGASTTYGSDAIGGVVNIITKKDLQGGPLQGPYNYAQVDAHVGMALDKGTYNEERYDAVVGYNNKGT